MKCWILKIILLFFSFSSFSKVEVKYFNKRFVWIEVPANSVKARLNLPIDGFSVCWIEVKNPDENFDFIFRRGLPYSTCMYYIEKIRSLLKKNQYVQIIGNAGRKEKRGEYFSMFEMIRGKTGCIGYFKGCEKFEKENIDWPLWKDKPIDFELYP